MSFYHVLRSCWLSSRGALPWSPPSRLTSRRPPWRRLGGALHVGCVKAWNIKGNSMRQRVVERLRSGFAALPSVQRKAWRQLCKEPQNAQCVRSKKRRFLSHPEVFNCSIGDVACALWAYTWLSICTGASSASLEVGNFVWFILQPETASTCFNCFRWLPALVWIIHVCYLIYDYLWQTKSAGKRSTKYIQIQRHVFWKVATEHGKANMLTSSILTSWPASIWFKQEGLAQNIHLL